MDEPLYRVQCPENTHLAPSRKTKGAVRGTCLDDDTNSISGQAEFIEVKQRDDRSELSDLIAKACLVGLGVAATIAAPHVKSWYSETLRPAMQRRIGWPVDPLETEEAPDAASANSTCTSDFAYHAPPTSEDVDTSTRGAETQSHCDTTTLADELSDEPLQMCGSERPHSQAELHVVAPTTVELSMDQTVPDHFPTSRANDAVNDERLLPTAGPPQESPSGPQQHNTVILAQEKFARRAS